MLDGFVLGDPTKNLVTSILKKQNHGNRKIFLTQVSKNVQNMV